MLHAHFVRSDVARAKIRVDVSAARDAEGVVAVLTGADLNDKVAGSMYPSMFVGAEDFMAPMYPLAIDDVRFVGDPIVLIIARSRYLAEDAAELVEIDYDDITDPIMDYDTALAGDGNNVHANRPGNVVSQMAVPMTDEGRAAIESAAHGRHAELRAAPLLDDPDGVPRHRGAAGSRSTSGSTCGCRARTPTRPARCSRAPRACPRTRCGCRSATSAAASA